MGVIISNFDKTLVSKYASLSAFGIYAAGALEIPIFSMLSASFSQSTFPKYVALLKENKKQEAVQLWISITNKVSKITYPILLLLMFFAKTIFVLIYSYKLEMAVPVFKIFLLICLWRNNYYGSLISASGKTKWITFYSLLNLILMGSGCWFCFQFFGFKALPWVIFSSTSFVAIMQLVNEKMFKNFLVEFLLKPVNLIFIALIIAAFLFSPF
jgi:O-antigen/teichoic acid export membrane protein